MAVILIPVIFAGRQQEKHWIAAITSNMHLKNLPTFMKPIKENMPAFLFRWRFLIAILISLTLLLIHGCKKKETTPIQDTYQQYFEQNVLNRDYIVELA